MLRFVIIALLLAISFDIAECQNNNIVEYNFTNGILGLDSNWILGGNWIGTPTSCSPSCPACGFALSTGEVKCPDTANITIINVIGPSNLEFCWKKSGANTKFEAYLDDQTEPIDNIDCEGYDWNPESIYIPPGSHSIKWILNFARNRVGDCIPGTRGTGWLCDVKAQISAIPTTVIEPQTETEPVVSNATGDVLPPVTEPVTSTEQLGASNCINVREGDDLAQILRNSSNKEVCLESGDYMGGIVLAGVHDASIRSIYPLGANLNGNSKEYNLVLNDCNNVSIKDIFFGDSINGILLNNSKNCKIRSDVIQSNSGISIQIVNNSNNNKVFANDIQDDGIDNTPAISIELSSNNYISCNHIDSEGYCYFFDNSTNNELYSDQNSSIYSDGSSYAIRPRESEIFKIVPTDIRRSLGKNCTVEGKNHLYCMDAKTCP